MSAREKYRATVTTNEDPEQRGRIKVACVGLMGSEEEEVPIWVEPSFAWGWFVIPDPGEIVEVEVMTAADDDEQFGQVTIDAPDLRWTMVRDYGNDEADEEQLKRPVPEDFTASNYGKRRGFATPLGHVFLFDDTPDDPKVSLSWKSGDGDGDGYAFFTFDKQGVKIASKPHGSEDVQHCIFLNHEDGEVSIIDSTGNSIATMSDGIKLVAAKDGASATNVSIGNDGVVMILAEKQVTCSAPAVQLDSGGIKLGSGIASLITEVALLGDVLIGLLDAHTHSTGMGPSGPPIGSPGLFNPAKATEVQLK